MVHNVAPHGEIFPSTSWLRGHHMITHLIQMGHHVQESEQSGLQTPAHDQSACKGIVDIASWAP